MTFDEFLSHLDGAHAHGKGQFSAHCPGPLHEKRDQNPSLMIAAGEKGILLHCFVGCTAHDITHALGLKLSDLFYQQRRHHKKHAFTAAELLTLLRNEALVIAIAAEEVAAQRPLSENDLQRVRKACDRISRMAASYT